MWRSSSCAPGSRPARPRIKERRTLSSQRRGAQAPAPCQRGYRTDSIPRLFLEAGGFLIRRSPELTTIWHRYYTINVNFIVLLDIMGWQPFWTQEGLRTLAKRGMYLMGLKPLLEISLLGGFRLAYRGKPVAKLNTPRLQALVAYLLLNQTTPVARQQLASLFWPNTNESQARTNLRHLLHTLRSSLPNSDDFLVGDGYTIGWNKRAS